MEPPSDDVNHKKCARIRELKQNGTQIQVKETTLQLCGFANCYEVFIYFLLKKTCDNRNVLLEIKLFA